MSKAKFKYAAVAVSIIGFVIPAFSDAIGSRLGMESQSVLIIGFSIGLGFFALSSWIEFFTLQTEIESSRLAIERSVRNRRDFINEGSANEAMRTLSDRFARAVMINNVYMPFASRPNIYYSLRDRARIEAINRFLARDDAQKYTEVIGRDAYLNVAKEYRGEIIDPRSKFDLRVTNRVFPFLNFIVFEYDGYKDEVLFGWGGYANLNSARVYSTTEPDVVQMFQELFSTLLEVSGAVGTESSVIGKLERCLGIWVDVSVARGQEKAKRCVNAAVLEFYMDEPARSGGEKRMAVRGIAFGLDCPADPDIAALGPLLREFSSTSCEMRGSKVYVAHRSSDPFAGGVDSESYGQSTYDFGRLPTTSRMYGTVFAADRITNAEETCISTLSIKLEESDARAVVDAWRANNMDKVKALISPHVRSLVKEAT